MKRLLCAAAAALTCTLAFAQGATITLDNQEDSPFYYVVDPPPLAGLTAASPLLASKVSAYFSVTEAGAGFASIDPGKQSRITGMAAGSHLLVGFFALPDTDEFPVRVMALRAEASGDRYYTIYAAPSQLMAHRGVGKLGTFERTTASAAAASGGQAAGTTAAAGAQTSTHAGGAASGTGGSSSAAAGVQSAPTLASFSPSYDPVVFTRETTGGFEVLPISDSRSWKQTGTRIASVEGSLDSQQGLRLVLDVPGGFSSSVSYFLYVFDSRSAGTDNTLTLEIEPVARGAHGACILWQKNGAPRLLGTVTTAPASVQLDVGAGDLAALASGDALPAAELTVDLTAGWYDKALGMWEEFYYATLTPTR
jgi:hypothetical protein